MRVGIVHPVAEVVAANHHDETVLPNGFHEQFHTRNFDGAKFGDGGSVLLVTRPPGPAIRNLARSIERAEVAANGDILGSDGEVDAQRFQNAATDAVLEWVVAEEREVPRSAARRDARQHGCAETADAVANHGIEVWSRGGFHLGFAARFERQPAEAVGHEKNDLGVCGLAELLNQFVDVHA